jgi:hypothetical protein
MTAVHIYLSKNDRVVSPDFATFSRPTELIKQSMCLLVWAAFWDQDVGLKMSFDNTLPMKINLRHNFKRPFY